MKSKACLFAALSVFFGVAQAADLCALNPYTASEARLGKIAFDSRCAMCHQFNMSGRVPGNALMESPDIKVLSADDLTFLDNGGGNVPPLLGEKFFAKQSGKTLAEFSAFVSSAANTFPTAGMKSPETFFHIAAYILYVNCGKMSLKH